MDSIITNSQEMNYIAIIDLLGIKELAQYEPLKYFNAMRNFLNSIVESSNMLKGEKKKEPKFEIYFFSDCAYLQSSNLIILLEFIRNVRVCLFGASEDNHYMTGAITTGNLKAVSINSYLNELNKKLHLSIIDSIDSEQFKFIHESIKSPDFSNNLNFNGTIFQSEDVSRVYSMQNELKGIGIRIDRQAIDNFIDTNKTQADKLQSYLSKSFYLVDIDSKTMISFTDLALDQTERGYFGEFHVVDSDSDTSNKTQEKKKIHSFLDRYLSANTKTEKFGRYYLTYLANWINSENFSQLEFIYDDEKKQYICHSHDNSIISDILNVFILEEDPAITELKTKANGFDFLYFALINKLYESNLVDDTLFRLMYKIVNSNPRLNKYFNKIKIIPDDIISSKNKDKLIKTYTDIISKKRKYKALCESIESIENELKNYSNKLKELKEVLKINSDSEDVSSKQTVQKQELAEYLKNILKLRLEKTWLENEKKNVF